MNGAVEAHVEEGHSNDKDDEVCCGFRKTESEKAWRECCKQKRDDQTS